MRYGIPWRDFGRPWRHETLTVYVTLCCPSQPIGFPATPLPQPADLRYSQDSDIPSLPSTALAPPPPPSAPSHSYPPNCSGPPSSAIFPLVAPRSFLPAPYAWLGRYRGLARARRSWIGLRIDSSCERLRLLISYGPLCIYELTLLWDPVRCDAESFFRRQRAPRSLCLRIYRMRCRLQEHPAGRCPLHSRWPTQTLATLRSPHPTAVHEDEHHNIFLILLPYDHSCQTG